MSREFFFQLCEANKWQWMFLKTSNLVDIALKNQKPPKLSQKKSLPKKPWY